MNIEKMREEFEACCAHDHLDRKGDGYKYKAINRYWQLWTKAWLSSRAAIEVELDRPLSDGGAILQYAKDHSAIESLGLKVKS